MSPRYLLLTGLRSAWMWRCAPGLVRLGMVVGLLAGLATGGAQAAPGIYTCVDAKGKRLTSDRPIAECLDREQKLLNKDGSLRLTVPPRKNAEERAAEEERRHLAELQEAARKDAIRRDRNLVMRYPDKAAHDKARESVLEDLRRSVNASERHLKTLEEERQPLIAETEFYKNKRLPPKLRTRMEANEAQQKAQRDIIQTQKTEMQRVGALYDAELDHLKKLWGGAPPGSLHPENAGSPRAGIKPGR
jgi:Domain of unknown function (DUF4124)